MTFRGRTRYIDSLPLEQRELARCIYKAVYNAALGMRDEEIKKVVDHAINRARMDLSS